MIDTARLPETVAGKIDHLVEEAAETIQAAMKIKRFGFSSSHPEESEMNNAEKLDDELNDLRLAIERYQCSRLGSSFFDLVRHLERQGPFSRRTFGPGLRTRGVCDHIRKELAEIESNPTDLEEWIDVIILGFDGALRTGATPAEICAAMQQKQAKNETRKWPYWRSVGQDKATEHDRSNEDGGQT